MAPGAFLTRRRLLAAMLVMGLSSAVGCSYGPEVRGPFRGQVVEAETGAPLPGVIVLASWPFESGPLKPRDIYDAQETVTDANGRFELQGLQGPIAWPSVLPPRLYLFLPGYEWTLETEVVSLDGQAFVDPTVTSMRRLETREQRCESLDRNRPLLDHPNMRRFREARIDESVALACGEVR